MTICSKHHYSNFSLNWHPNCQSITKTPKTYPPTAKASNRKWLEALAQSSIDAVVILKLDKSMTR